MNCLRFFKPPKIFSLCRVGSVRYISQNHLKIQETEDKWRSKDGLAEKWKLIYKAPMGDILNYTVVYLTCSTAIVSAAALYYAAFAFDVSTMNDPVLFGPDVVIANNVTECLIYVGGFILFHVAVKILISKFVIRLYKNNDEYIAIFQGYWFNSTKKHKFHLQEFKKLNPTFVVSWGDARFGLGKKHGILLSDYFKTPEYFNYLLYKQKSR